MNKIDKIPRAKLLELSAALNDAYGFRQTFMISALKGDGLDGFIKYIAQLMPDGPFMYDPDQVSDMTLRQMAAEITREKIYEFLHQEIPYSCAIKTDRWVDAAQSGNGKTMIAQTILVSKQNLKGMILGKQGQMIKRIGTAARKDIEDLVETPVHLELFVKVDPKWVDDPELYQEWGMDF